MEQTVFRHWKIRLSNRSMQGIPRNSRAFCSAVSLNDEVARRLRIHFKNYNAYSPSERHSEEQKTVTIYTGLFFCDVESPTGEKD